MTAPSHYFPTPQEQAQLREVAQKLRDEAPALQLHLRGEAQDLALPLPVLELIATLIREAAAGHAVSLLPTEQELSTTEAAQLLGISRPFLVSHLLETGKLPYQMVGTHRRIALRDVLAYQAEQAQRRTLAAELTREAQALGLP